MPALAFYSDDRLLIYLVASCGADTPTTVGARYAAASSGQISFIEIPNIHGPGTGNVTGPDESLMGELALFSSSDGQHIYGMPFGNPGDILRIPPGGGTPVWDVPPMTKIPPLAHGAYIYAASLWPDGTRQSLVLLASADGKSFIPITIKPPYAVDGTHYLQEPSIIWNAGYWWICYTYGLLSDASGTVFQIIRSPDLVNWTLVTSVSMSSITGVRHVWAPEFFVDDDGTVRVYVTCNTNGTLTDGFVIYETHATNAALTTWSTPVLVTGTGLPSSILDAYMLKSGGTYYLWYKDNVTQYNCYATSTNPTSGFTEIHDGNWTNWGIKSEGPTIIPLPDGTWRAYLQHYENENTPSYTTTQWWSEALALSGPWSAKTQVVTPWPIMRGTVLRVTDPDALGMLLAATAQAPGGRWMEGTGDVGVVLNAGINAAAGNQKSYLDLQLNGVSKAVLKVDEGTSGSPLELNVPLKNTVADGTPPLQLTSKSLIVNLNSEMLGGKKLAELTLSALGDLVLTGLTNGQILKWDTATSKWVNTTLPAGNAHIIQDEGVDLTPQARLDFQGAGVTATDDTPNGKTIITIPGGGAGSGDVVGPAGATNGHLVVFDGATGKLVKDGGAVPSGSGSDYMAARTKPTLASFTWFNQGLATVVDEADGLFMDAPALAGDNVKMLLKTIGRTSWSCTACFYPISFPINYVGFGLVLYESSTQKICGVIGESGANLIAKRWTNPTTFNINSKTIATDYGYLSKITWMRIRGDATNIYYDFSPDGIHWLLLNTESKTGFLTGGPSHFGVAVSASNANYPSDIRWLHWSET
jgi:hypothetical protein